MVEAKGDHLGRLLHRRSSNFGSLPEDFQRGVSTRPEKFCLGSIMKNKSQFRSGRAAKRFGRQPQKPLQNVLPTRSALASTFSQTFALQAAPSFPIWCLKSLSISPFTTR